MKNQRIHFIGICGVAMSALALAFKKQNWHVTGSDVGFYPPISTYLKDNGVEYYAGWHPDKMIAGGVPDLVVIGGVASSTNPEWLYAQEHKLNYKSYPEVIKEFFVKANSIVCAGTYGKTTSSALLTWILKEAGVDPTYMFGGLMTSSVGAGFPRPQSSDNVGVGGETPPLPSAGMSDTNWSVLEGDEYKASRWDNGPKFFYYAPTHLLLTSIVWDHADVYPTEELYIDAFKKLVNMVPANGTLVVSEQAIPRWGGVANLAMSRGGFALNETHTPTHPVPPATSGHPAPAGITVYGPTPNSDYSYSNITQTKNGITFTITEKVSSSKYQVSSSCLGDYMADNITGCFAMCRAIGIEPEKIIAAVQTFPGMKRRLEKRFEGAITIFDDIAHSATKAASTLATIRQVYDGNIIAVFEPNTGNRRPQAKLWYDNAFKDADVVLIPRLTKVKLDDKEEAPMEGEQLTAVVQKTHTNTSYIDEDEKLVEHIASIARPGDVVVFLGSHGFRGMIEQLVSRLSL